MVSAIESPHAYPREPKVGVGCLVLRKDKILLVKRKYPPNPGKWSIPGGHMELGESILETAARELEEETGLKGKPLGVVNVDDFIMKDKLGRIKYQYVLVTVLLDAPT
jgi:ADP-ribose pyrophosphatase